jgi:hypothetical protein
VIENANRGGGLLNSRVEGSCEYLLPFGFQTDKVDSSVTSRTAVYCSLDYPEGGTRNGVSALNF